MSMMFIYCSSLTELDLSNFDTINVTDMSNMFYDCTSLTTLDLSNFNINNEANINYMFYECNSLHTLRLDNCSNDTISKLIASSDFPTDAISGVIRTIYCKEENAAGLTAPTNWVFSYVD
jgi:surface protein